MWLSTNGAWWVGIWSAPCQQAGEAVRPCMTCQTPRPALLFMTLCFKGNPFNLKRKLVGLLLFPFLSSKKMSPVLNHFITSKYQIIPTACHHWNWSVSLKCQNYFYFYDWEGKPVLYPLFQSHYGLLTGFSCSLQFDRVVVDLLFAIIPSNELQTSQQDETKADNTDKNCTPNS